MRPYFVAIVGGSCSGKSWLAADLSKAIHGRVARLSLDDFYRDRSHLSPTRRSRINFDHPRAIDWPLFHQTVLRLKAGKPARAPRYDFKTHTRFRSESLIQPKPFVLVDGLWVLRPPRIRRLFDFSIFLDCSRSTRLRRRLSRDRLARGRTRESICAQFVRAVEPMHERFVLPQARHARFILNKAIGQKEVRSLAACLIKSAEQARQGRKSNRQEQAVRFERRECP